MTADPTPDLRALLVRAISDPGSILSRKLGPVTEPYETPLPSETVSQWAARAAEAAVLPAHERMVLDRAADELQRRGNDVPWSDPGLRRGIQYATAVVRRLAATAPPTGPAAPDAAGDGPAVPEQAPEDDGGYEPFVTAEHFTEEVSYTVGTAVPETTPEPAPVYRVGRKLGRTVFCDEQLIGVMDTRELAALVVDALNGESAASLREKLRQVRAELETARSDVEELRSQRDYAMRELKAKTEAYDALGTEANTRLVRAVNAEAERDRLRLVVDTYDRVALESDLPLPSALAAEGARLAGTVQRYEPVIEAAREMVAERNERHGNPSNPDWWSGWDFKLVAAVAALDDAGTGRDAEIRAAITCELPVDEGWCALPIGHKEPCVPAGTGTDRTENTEGDH